MRFQVLVKMSKPLDIFAVRTRNQPEVQASNRKKMDIVSHITGAHSYEDSFCPTLHYQSQKYFSVV